MPSDSQAAIDAWKEANEDARIAETILARAWDEYFAKRAPAPDEAAVKKVQTLRFRASELLLVAMNAVKLR